MFPRIAAALIAFHAITLLGAEVKLGPEIPLVPVRLGPAAFHQSEVIAASNGRDSLAVWRDRREQVGWPHHLYATRLDAAGQPADPFGRKLDVRGSPARLASDGDHYLFAYFGDRDSSSHIQVLDENGLALGADRQLQQRFVDAESNGRGYLLVVAGDKGLELESLDRDGAVLGSQPLGLTSPLSGLRVNRGRYDFLGYASDCRACGTPVLETIDVDGGTFTVSETKLQVSLPQNARARVTEDRILFAWVSNENEIQYTIVDRAGRVLTPATAIRTPAWVLDLTVFWDGEEFLLAASQQRTTWSAQRIRPDGALVSPGPNVITTNGATALRFVSNRTSQLLVWTETEWPRADGHVVARPLLHGFRDLANASLPAPIAYSGRSQRDVRVAWANSRLMAVWRDESAHEILAALDGTEMPIEHQSSRRVGNPSVTAGEDRFLVTWFDDDGGSSRLMARRFALDGTALDEQPIVVSAGTKRILDDAPGVTAEGSSFYISDDLERGQIRFLRLDGSSGFVEELWRHTPASCPSINPCWGSFPPTKTASDWIVPYLVYRGARGAVLSPVWALRILQMPLSGGSPRTLQMNQSLFDWEATWTGMTRVGDQFVFFYPSSWSLTLEMLDGSTLTERIIRVFDAPNYSGPDLADIVWNGSEYVVVWSGQNGGPIGGIRLDRQGNPLDGAPFMIAEGSNELSRPSIAVTDDGVIIAYTRAAVENGGAPRAFTRTLPRLSPVARRPSARH